MKNRAGKRREEASSAGLTALTVGSALLSSLVLPLAGCAGFFVKPTTTTTTPTTGSTPATTGDYAYVANSSAGSTSLSEYNVGAGSLTSIGNITLGYIPVALAVAPSNSFLYVASAPGSTSPGVYLYSITASSGVLAAANNGTALADRYRSRHDRLPRRKLAVYRQQLRHHHE